MSDYRSPVEIEGGRLSALAALSRMHFCRPGYIEKFDPATNLAEVTPAITAKVTDGDTVDYRQLPMIIRVPVVVPYAPMQGLCITLPIKKGDPCLLLFSDRFLDNFVKDFKKGGKPVPPEACGGDNKTTEPRMHHLTDAICIPGLYGQPDKIPNWNPDRFEIRDAKRECYLSLGADKTIEIRAPGGVKFIDTPTVEVPDGDVIADSVSLVNHVNTGVMPGAANTGPPAK